MGQHGPFGIKRKILTLNGQGGLQGAGPVAVAELAGVEVVRGELACPRRLEVRGDLGDRQAAGGGALVQGAVDPRHVGDAGPAEEAPAARGQRQVEQDGVVRDRGNQRTQVVAGTLRSRDWGIVRHEACSAGTSERHKL